MNVLLLVFSENWILFLHNFGKTRKFGHFVDDLQLLQCTIAQPIRLHLYLIAYWHGIITYYYVMHVAFSQLLRDSVTNFRKLF